MSVITPRRMVLAWARGRAGSPPRVAAAAPAASSWRRAVFMARAPFPSAADQRAVALGDRPERLLRRRGLQRLQVVPRAAALLGLLHLEEEGGDHVAPVRPDAAAAEGVVLHRHGLHA